MPCSIGANHCRLRHIGWERCGHGLTSNPRECASEPFLDELLQLFHYPPRSARALLSGTLPLRYCAARFAGRAPTWRLPLSGHGGSLVTAVEGEGVEDARREVHWVSGCGPGRKRIRLNRKKTLHTLWVLVSNLGHVCGRNCVMWGFQLILLLDYRRRRYGQRDDGCFPVQNRTGWVNSREECRPTSPFWRS